MSLLRYDLRPRGSDGDGRGPEQSPAGSDGMDLDQHAVSAIEIRRGAADPFKRKVVADATHSTTMFTVVTICVFAYHINHLILFKS